MAAIDESSVEEMMLAALNSVGYQTLSGSELTNSNELVDSEHWFITGRLTSALKRLNPAIPDEALERATRTLSHSPQPTLIQNNRWFHSLLTDGIEVEYYDAQMGESRGGRVRLIDYEEPEHNDLLVVQQLDVVMPSGRLVRPDLTIFLNGLPIVIIGLKHQRYPTADLNTTINELKLYTETAPELFVPNVVLVASDGLRTLVGSITSSSSRFMPWRSTEAHQPSWEAVIRELLEPARLVDYLRTCVVFEENARGEITKLVGGYHQFRAVRTTRESVLAHLKPPIGKGDGRGGVVWHAQGSGKSLTMLMLAGALVREPVMANPTIVIVTDRTDLGNQLFATAVAGHALLRQLPSQADSRRHLKELLDRAAGGVIFTTVYKFAEAQGTLSERANVVVIADQAHRTQYGALALNMRNALPNATFVGFTGTPLDREGRNTVDVFGDYSDVYDIGQAVEDGATRPLYYESQIIKLTADYASIAAAQAELDRLAVDDASGEEAPYDIRIPLGALVGAPDRVQRLAVFIVEHWEKRRAAMEGKAMVVVMSRDIAARLYEAIKALRPSWDDPDDEHGVMKVIISGSGEEWEPLRSYVRTNAAHQRLAERFKDPDDDFRVVIVCDMWLSGFDCPSAHTMYLDKPLAGHVLMQAITRVNRVFGEKRGGLIVDTLGLAARLADALTTYAQAGGRGEAIMLVEDEAVPAMGAAYEKLRGFLNGCAYEAAFDSEPQSVLHVYLAAIDHVFAQPDGWRRFRAMVRELSAAFALAVPRPETEAIARHLAFYQRVTATILMQLTDESDADETEGQRDVDAAMRQVIGGAIGPEGVIDLFAAAGLDEAQLDILSDEFLERVAALEQRNLALEILRKVLTDQIRITERTNIVQSRRFHDAFENVMLQYTNKAITTAEVISRLVDLGQAVREAQQHGEEPGLSALETAFYDALAENPSAQQVMKDETLRLIARELAKTVNNMPKLDWTQRESVRAGLRRSVRRLLVKYGYPPDITDNATQLVLRQVELSTASTE